MEDWDEALADLRREYVREAPLRLADLNACLDRLRETPRDADLLQELRRGFHVFAGSGRTYGFERVTDLGRAGEQRCLDALDRGAALPADLDAWASLARDLEHDVHAAASPHDPGVGPAPEAIAADADAPDALVVDDDPAIVRLLAQLLAQEGCVVREAATLATARAALEARVPDVLVTDVMLPDGKGYALVEELRQRPDGDAAVVLVVSVRSDFFDRVEAIHCGADAYFEKPVDWEAFRRQFRQILDARSTTIAKVLSVEDDPLQAALIGTILRSGGYEVRVCGEPRHFETDLASFQPDLVLMDVLLPDVSGYDLVRVLRQQEKHATTPVVMLTAENRIAARISAARCGADDFIIKPIVPGLLLSTVAARIERARFLRGLLERDGLTQLLTHTAFLGRAQSAVARAQRRTRPLMAWAMIDVDHFKKINDRHGHPTGDRVLVSLAQHLRRHLRQSDSVGRYGGEEFAVLVEDLEIGDAVRLFDRLRSDFARLQHRAPSGEKFSATFSVGVAPWGDAGDTLGEWRQRADSALYRAKDQGRNRVVAATAETPGAPPPPA